MPIEQGGIAALLIKYKAAAYLASLSGALLIAMTNPPKTRKALFYHAASALIASFLFGEFAVSLLANWVNIPRSELLVPVFGFVGGMGWGIAGAMSTFSQRFAKDPVQAIKDVKDVV